MTQQEVWLQLYCAILQSTDSKLFVGTTEYKQDILLRSATLTDKAILHYNDRFQQSKKDSK